MLVAAALYCSVASGPAVASSQAPPRFAKWQTIELALSGPKLRSRGGPNPFAVMVEGTFTAPGGRTFRVPGFYDGDGRGGPDGPVWKLRFAADEVGAWTWRSRSANSQLDGQAGSFTVVPPAADAPDFYRWGRLEAVATAENNIRYLKFRDGPYWLKAGCDDPENFLGDYQHYDTLKKRKAAVDYLAGRGINSLYIMSHNIDGDDNDVWPWLGETAREAKANAVATSASTWPTGRVACAVRVHAAARHGRLPGPGRRQRLERLRPWALLPRNHRPLWRPAGAAVQPRRRA